MTNQIVVRGARLHNLKNVTVAIPKDQLVVLTGVSGSGKSTLGFDILFKEGLRQFFASVGMVEFGLAKPPVDSISGLSPTISIDQHLTNRSPRSTVGTTTDVYTYLRVLYSRLGHRPCPNCGKDVAPSFGVVQAESVESADTDSTGSDAAGTFPCPHCGASIPQLEMASFSFNKPEGACPTCTGLGVVQQVDTGRLINEQKSIAAGAVVGWNDLQIKYNTTTLAAAARHYGFKFDPSLPFKKYKQAQRDLILYGVESPRFRQHFPRTEPPATVRQGRFEGVATSVLRRFGEHIQAHVNEEDYRDKLDEFLVTEACTDCGGTRLRPESRIVTVRGKTIIEASRLALIELGKWLQDLPESFNPDEKFISEPILSALSQRIGRLIDVGAGYLTPERASVSLSAGESQRLRLASLLGSDLSGLLYVFDEPTIGLHARDTRRLIGVLHRLRDLGNTVLVIEHDLEMIKSADYVIDFGPGAGRQGGRIVAAGSPQEISKQADSVTGDYLAGRSVIPVPRDRRVGGAAAITIHGAREHNLHDVSVRVPLGLLVAVTGVSGSGKSSLVFDVLDRALRQRMNGGGDVPGQFDSIQGIENLEKVITIDQEHIGRIPRSNAATYSDAFTAIRDAFAATPDAQSRGMKARHFSFNVPGGRCERCEGAGVLTVKMQLLPDAEVVCPVCHGRRFTGETLEVRYRDHDIAQVLDMTVDDALELFKEIPAAEARLRVLSDVGLGYVQLGQPATTLSGGEAQRVKLAKELARRVTGRTLYLLDEPTTGLHVADTARLLAVLQRLVDAGNSVIVVEHNLEVIKVADWVIDLGPEGGDAGGRVIAEGTPEQIARQAGSYTGQALRSVLSMQH